MELAHGILIGGVGRVAEGPDQMICGGGDFASESFDMPCL